MKVIRQLNLNQGEAVKEDESQALALFKFGIISPVLMEPHRAQAEYFRNLSLREHNIPRRGLSRIKIATMKSWLYQYKKQGFKGLQGKSRCDTGSIRFHLTEEGFNCIKSLRGELQHLSVAQFYRKCLLLNMLGSPPMHETTLRRHLNHFGLKTLSEPKKSRKRYEMSSFGELWVGDFMHGPKVYASAGKKTLRKAILLAFIDDHSRYIVGAQFNLLENTQTIELVLKQALLTHGVPQKIYVDNGPSFSSHYLLKVCAELNISLVHSKPYDSPSRGKIERFFRTVRGKFLIDFKEDSSQVMDLKELNERFEVWLKNDYLEYFHKGINTSPMNRYMESIQKVSLKRVNEDLLDQYFLTGITRKVNKDATISINKIIYEVPPSYIGESVSIKWPLDRPKEIYLYEGNKKIQKITPVDAIFNGRYRPSPRTSNISLQNKKGDK